MPDGFPSESLFYDANKTWDERAESRAGIVRRVSAAATAVSQKEGKKRLRTWGDAGRDRDEMRGEQETGNERF